MDRKSNDFTTGHPTKKLLMFSLPLIAIMVLQSLYNTADSIVVGQFVGEDALAAVNSAGNVTQIVMLVLTGISTGLSVLVSQYYGAKDYDMLRKSVTTSSYVIAVFSVVFGAIGAIFARTFLIWIRIPDNILDDATLYLTIIMLGTPATAFYNMANGVARSVGDGITPMIVLIVTAVLNVGLNVLFVAGFGMGVAGVALATVIATIISAIACIILIFKRIPMVRPTRDSAAPSREVIKNLVKLGVPSALQSSANAIGGLAVQVVINGFGSTVIAAYSSARHMEALISYPPGGFTGAMQVWTGQNVGAGKYERVKQGYNATVKVIAIYTVFSVAVLLCFGKQLMTLFTSGDEFINIGAQYLACACTGMFSVGMLYLSRSTLVGAGDASASVYCTAIEIVVRVISAFVLSNYFGYYGVFFASPIGSTAGAIYATVRYLSGKWKNKSIVRRNPAEALAE